MKLQLLALLPLASTASASWSKNLNYRSPSEHHPARGISIHRVVKRNDPQSSYETSSLNFTHGVASGDPYPNSVILWTRVAPQSDNSQSNLTVTGYAPLFDHDNEKYVHVSKSPVCVEYKVAADKNLTSAVDSGKVYTSSDVDFTVKVSNRSEFTAVDRPNMNVGRSEEFETVHDVLLPVQRLQLEQQKPARTDKDNTKCR
jgi:alkaline phosphatase D